MEIESVRKTQTKKILEMENLREEKRNHRAKHHHQNTRSGGENLMHRRLIEEIDTTGKEKSKSKKISRHKTSTKSWTP